MMAACTQPVYVTSVTEPVVTEPASTEPATYTPKPKEIILIKPIPNYPAYIVDACSVLWGIPRTTQGPLHKEKIDITTTDGTILDRMTIDFFTRDGVIYVTHSYDVYPDFVDGHETLDQPTHYIDYYRQTIGTDVIESAESIPEKPVERKAQYDGIEWLIELSVINGVETSFMYCRNKAVVAEKGEYLPGKGTWCCQRQAITDWVILDKGILVMTERGGEMIGPKNMAMTEISEKGRIWK